MADVCWRGYHSGIDGNMRGFAISNLAWPAASTSEAFDLVRASGFDAVEIAPGKIAADWPDAPTRFARLRQELDGQGLKVAALQAILSGVTGAGLFTSLNTRKQLASHLCKVARIAGVLGASACVFGAPKSRDPGTLTLDSAFEIAAIFFASIAPAFYAEGTCLAFEANAALYGCRFITHTDKAAELVRRVNHPGFRLQIDTGTIFINGEDAYIIEKVLPLASHLHVSEPGLVPIGSVISDHTTIAGILKKGIYDGWISVEMKETDTWRLAIKRARRVLEYVYGANRVRS